LPMPTMFSRRSTTQDPHSNFLATTLLKGAGRRFSVDGSRLLVLIDRQPGVTPSDIACMQLSLHAVMLSSVLVSRPNFWPCPRDVWPWSWELQWHQPRTQGPTTTAKVQFVNRQ